jgi:hypothetical protein
MLTLLFILSIAGGCTASDQQRVDTESARVAGCYEFTWRGDSTYSDGVLPRRLNLSLEVQPFPPEVRDSAGFAAVLPAAQAAGESVTWWYGHLAWWRVNQDSLAIILGGPGEGVHLTLAVSDSSFIGSAERWTDYGDSGDFQVHGARIDCMDPETVVHTHTPPASEYPLPLVYAKWPYRSVPEPP